MNDVSVKFDADTQAYELGQQRMLRSNQQNLRSLSQIDTAMSRIRTLQAQQGSELAKIEADLNREHKKRLQTVEQLGHSAMLTGALFLAGYGMAIKSFAEFDQQMDAVGAATMANETRMNQLRVAALEAGASTAFSAREAAQAEEELAKAGVSVTDIIKGGLKGALDLAAAGNLDVAQAAEIAGTALSQFHLEGAATSHVADLLAAGAGKAQGSVQDLSGALKYVGPVAAGMGVSIEEVTGTLAMFASQGIIGEQAGTSLRGVISALTAPSAAAARTMGELGISVWDAQGNFIGLEGVAGQLQTRMAHLTEEERSQALGRMFGNEQLTAARVLYAQGAKGVDDWTEAVDQQGFAAEQAARKTDNLTGDVERLGGALSTALVTGGSGSNAVLRAMTQAATGAIDAYSAMPDPIEGVITGLAALAGGGLVALGAIATLTVRIAEFRDRLNDMGPAGERANTVIAGIGKWGARAGIVAGLVIGIWELGSAALHAAEDMFDLDGGASDVADALADIDTASVASSLRELGDTGRSIGWLAESFGSVSDAVREINYNLGRDKTVEYRAKIEALDNAFTNLMNNGQIDEATAAFARLAAEQIRQGGTADDILMQLPGFTGALQAYADANLTGAGNAGQLTAEQQTQIGVLEEAALTVDDLKDALDRLNGVNRSVGENQAAWTLGLESLTDTLKENGATVDTATEKGARNYQELARQAEIAEALAQAVFNSTGSYDSFAGSLETSRSQLVDSMVQMGFNEQQAWDLTNSILGIPPKADTTADMNTKPASDGRDAVLAMINQLNLTPATVYVKPSTDDFFTTMNAITTGTYRANVNVKYVTDGTQSSLLGQFYTPPKADGGLIVGPGGPREDNLLTPSSNGEFMVNAAAVEAAGLRNLRALNEGRFGDVDLGDRTGGHYPPAFVPPIAHTPAAPASTSTSHYTERTWAPQFIVSERVGITSRELARAAYAEESKTAPVGL